MLRRNLSCPAVSHICSCNNNKLAQSSVITRAFHSNNDNYLEHFSSLITMLSTSDSVSLSTYLTNNHLNLQHSAIIMYSNKFRILIIISAKALKKWDYYSHIILMQWLTPRSQSTKLELMLGLVSTGINDWQIKVSRSTQPGHPPVAKHIEWKDTEAYCTYTSPVSDLTV